MAVKERDFLQMIEKADRRFFAEAADRLAAPGRFAKTQKGNRRIMEKRNETKRHHAGKFAWGIGLAASLLGAGGITAAVAMQRHDTTTQKNEISDNMIEIADTIQPIEVIEPLNAFSPKLTDQRDNPAGGDIIETEYGYYFQGFVEEPRWLHGLRYCDKETGENVWFCTRANCLHDGNEYCVATTNVYSVSDITWFDGTLWAVAIKNDRQATSDDGNVYSYGMNFVLLRYEPDGSAVTEMAVLPMELPDNADEMIGFASLVAHRGVLWINTSYDIYCDVEDPFDLTDMQQSGAWSFYAYEPENKRVTTLMQTELAANTRTGGLSGMSGFGDYVYCVKPLGDSNPKDPFKPGQYRINCRTGQFELLRVLDFSAKVAAYPQLMNGSDLLFTGVREFIDTTDDGVNMQLVDNELHLYRFDTKQDSVFCHNCVGFTADADYIYALTTSDSVMTTSTNYYLVTLDWSGNIIAENALSLAQDRELYPSGENFYYYSGISCIGDTLYLKTGSAVYALSAEAARTGDLTMTPVYQYHEHAAEIKDDETPE